tara:strand:- start:131 stop:370 length:240 start_codon:yes stop_codon:yes gene_type:complete
MIEFANEFPIEYAQSIIVQQSNSKNGALKFIDYGVQRQQNEANNDFTKLNTTDINQEPLDDPTTGPGALVAQGDGTDVY